MRSDGILKVVAQTPNSIEQTLIARLNQVQDGNALISVPVGDRHNNVQIRLSQIPLGRFRFLASGPHELYVTHLFTKR